MKAQVSLQIARFKNLQAFSLPFSPLYIPSRTPIAFFHCPQVFQASKRPDPDVAAALSEEKKVTKRKIDETKGKVKEKSRNM